MTSSLDAWSLAALDALPVGVTVADAQAEDMPLVFVNAAFRKMTGYEAREVLGRNCRFLQGPGTDPEVPRRMRAAIANGERFEATLVNHRKDGTPFRNRVVLAPVRDAGGALTHYVGIQADVTSSESLEARAREDAERLHLLTQATHDAVWDWDIATGVVLRNPRHTELFGGKVTDDWSYGDWRLLVDPAQLPAIEKMIADALADPQRLTHEHTYRIRSADGRALWVKDRMTILRGADGRPHRALGAIADITGALQAETELRENAQRARQLLDLAFEAVSVYDASGKRIFRNAKGDDLAARYGLANALDGIHPDDVAGARAAYAELFATPGATSERTVRIRTRDGDYRWLETRGENRLDDPFVRGVVAHWRDVTERVEADREREDAAERERRLRELLFAVEDVAQIGGWELAVATGALRWTPGTHRIFETSPETYTPTLEDAVDFYAPEHRSAVLKAVQEASRNGATYTLDLDIITARGRRVPIRSTGRTESRDGEVVRVYGAVQDLSQEAAARAALRRQAAVLGQIRDAVVVLDLGGTVVSWNEGAARVYGLPANDVLGTRPALWDVRSTSLPASAIAAARTRGDQVTFDAKASRREGEIFDVRVSLAPFHDEQGTRIGDLALVQDITENKRLQAQLEASQRMEAVGLLAGGVAHDFNNLLTVVQGNADDLLETRALDDAMRTQLLEVREAARRAAELTRQLLAFGRKQVLRPVRLELSALVDDMTRLLQRIVGEHITVARDVRTSTAWVEADRAQLEQVLLNLAINARDAMPSGGHLTLGVEHLDLTAPTAELAAGRYCALVVRDDGIGMSDTVKARIFEPFFTTKDPARGTGLGLATVYGIVKQSGGAVIVESAPEQGSTFRVLLPDASSRAVEPVLSAPPERVRAAVHARETILLVEDDDAVRRVCRRVLEKQGYCVLEADRPEAALEIAKARPTGIALVLTDVVMPGMSGPELVQTLRRSHPGIRYLLISGYADDMNQLRAALDDGMTFLAKPFTPDQLARAVREALATTEPPPAVAP